MKIQFLFFISMLFFGVACTQPGAPIPPNTEQQLAPESSPPVAADARTDVLIYSGPGSWGAEIASLKEILFANGSTYEILSPQKLNRFTVEDYLKYKAILFAGGDAPTVRKVLSTETHARLREAVQVHGLNYIGFCAGAWLAVAPAPAPDEDVVYGLGVVDGPVLTLNFLAKQNRNFALDYAIFPDGSRRHLLWYGGPITPDVPGGVIAKYSDGTPAITQIRSGKGLVIVSGLHPAANKKILTNVGLFTREAIAPEFAWALFESVIHNKPLPAF